LNADEVEEIKNIALNEVNDAFKYDETQRWPDREDAIIEVYVSYPKENI
jgi:Pyruvate/2-oxoglutarate dehydrogenase complex, dehydrogenase (E1) component, eukaryotic type, alpha subunit